MSSVVVVSSNFCVPYPVDFTVFKDGEYGKEVNGNLMFLVEKCSSYSLHGKRVIIDASSGTPIITLRRKILTAHFRWQAFRGNSTDEEDKLFDAKTSSLVQLKTKLHVFLPNNKFNEELPDYVVKGGWSRRPRKIYSGNSSILLAKMKNKSKFFEIDKLLVTMNPMVDSAFIFSLIVIFHGIERDILRVGKVILKVGRVMSKIATNV